MLITKVSGSDNKTTLSIHAYTASAAASKLKVSVRSIYKWAEAGALREVSITSGDVLLVCGEDVDKLHKQFKKNPPKRGRKPKAS